MSKQTAKSRMDFTGTVIINETADPMDIESKNFQFVYAGQLFGTFFGVFGRFSSQKIDKNSHEIFKASFILINYRGSVNLGIGEKIMGKVDTIKVPEIPSGKPIPLKCLDFSIDIKPFAESFIERSATLVDNTIDDKIKHISITSKPINVFSDNNNKRPSVSETWFDGEQYERSGLFYKQRDIITSKTKLKDLKLMELGDTFTDRAPWGFCPRGVNQIVFA